MKGKSNALADCGVSASRPTAKPRSGTFFPPKPGRCRQIDAWICTKSKGPFPSKKAPETGRSRHPCDLLHECISCRLLDVFRKTNSLTERGVNPILEFSA